MGKRHLRRIEHRRFRRSGAGKREPRRTDCHFGGTGCRHGGEIERAQPFAGAAQRGRESRIAAGRQDALTRSDRGNSLGTIPAQCNGIGRHDCIGPTRQRASDINTARREAKRHWRIGLASAIAAAATAKPSRKAIGRGGHCGGCTSSASTAPKTCAPKTCAPSPCESGVRRGVTAATRDCKDARIASSGVSRAMRWIVESTVIATMIKAFARFYESQPMTEKTLNLRGLKCPLPALRTRKALSQSEPGDILIVECTDPLSGIDIPNLLRQTGDTLEDSRKDKKLLTFRIRKV
jgi:tRNA 2-thiouridine synthesizing protein A